LGPNFVGTKPFGTARERRVPDLRPSCGPTRAGKISARGYAQRRKKTWGGVPGGGERPAPRLGAREECAHGGVWVFSTSTGEGGDGGDGGEQEL